MKIYPDITKGCCDIRDVSYEEMRAIFSSLQHECIRAHHRATDERIGQEQREAEGRLKEVANKLAAGLGSFKRLWQ